MPTIKTQTNFTNIADAKDSPDFARFLSVFAQEVESIVNGNISFGENIKCDIISCVFGVADTNTNFGHKLGRIPLGYIPIASTSSARLYNGTVPNTKDTIYLRSSSAGTMTVVVL